MICHKDLLKMERFSLVIDRNNGCMKTDVILHFRPHDV